MHVVFEISHFVQRECLILQGGVAPPMLSHWTATSERKALCILTAVFGRTLARPRAQL